MSIHDGIPFVIFEFVGGKKAYLNPLHVSYVIDLSEAEAKKEQVTHPALKIIYNNGKEQHIGNMTASSLIERINKTMTEWKHKLAEKELLS